jgi:hypothetical protein
MLVGYANCAAARSIYPGGRPPDPPSGKPCSLTFGQLRQDPQYLSGGTTPGPPDAGLRPAYRGAGRSGGRTHDCRLSAKPATLIVNLRPTEP